MSAIAFATRRASYEAILSKVNPRQRLILETLGDREMTVSELTEELVAAGKLPYFNRNYVAPRLTELKDAEIVENCGIFRASSCTSGSRERSSSRIRAPSKEVLL